MRRASIHPDCRLVSVGDAKYRLENASGLTVGWIRGHAVGVAGFDSVAEAIASAPMLRRVVDGVLRRAYPARHHVVRCRGEPTLVHDGAYEWIANGSSPVARLHRPGTTHVPHQPSAGSYALEFVLPSFASEGATIAVARAIARARSSLVDSFEPAKTRSGGAAGL
jgi:hypothetical protein